MAKRSTISLLLGKALQRAKERRLLYRGRRTEHGGKAKKATTSKKNPSPAVDSVRPRQMSQGGTGYAVHANGIKAKRTQRGGGQLGYLLTDGNGKFAGHYLGEVMESPAAEIGATPTFKNDTRERQHIGDVRLDIVRVGDNSWEFSLNGRNVVMAQGQREVNRHNLSTVLDGAKLPSAVDLQVDDTLSLNIPINLTVI
jgi:hypothetical protein